MSHFIKIDTYRENYINLLEFNITVTINWQGEIIMKALHHYDVQYRLCLIEYLSAGWF